MEEDGIQRICWGSGIVEEVEELRHVEGDQEEGHGGQKLRLDGTSNLET